jgi:hypothetical protein
MSSLVIYWTTWLDADYINIWLFGSNRGYEKIRQKFNSELPQNFIWSIASENIFLWSGYDFFVWIDVTMEIFAAEYGI